MAATEGCIGLSNVTPVCTLLVSMLASPSAVQVCSTLRCLLERARDDAVVATLLGNDGLVLQLLTNIQYYNKPDSPEELAKTLHVFAAVLRAAKTAPQKLDIAAKAHFLPALLVEVLENCDSESKLALEAGALLKVLSGWCEAVPQIASNALKSGTLRQLLAHAHKDHAARKISPSKCMVLQAIFTVLLHSPPGGDLEVFVEEGIAPLLVRVLGSDEQVVPSALIALALQCVDKLITIDPEVPDCVRLCARRSAMIAEYGGWESVNVLTYSACEEVQRAASRICMKRYPKLHRL